MPKILKKSDNDQNKIWSKGYNVELVIENCNFSRIIKGVK